MNDETDGRSVEGIDSYRRDDAVGLEGQAETIQATIRALRPLGFFEDMTDDEILAEVFSSRAQALKRGSKWGIEFATASIDDARIAGYDPRCDPQPGTKTYIRLVRNIGRISRGALDIRTVEEEWPESNRGTEYPVKLSIRTASAAAEFYPEQLGLSGTQVIAGLNPILPPGSPKLVHLSHEDAILALTESEQETLRSRGWLFEDEVDPPPTTM